MRGASSLLLLSSLAAAPGGAAPPPKRAALPHTDAVINLDHKMERLEPQVLALSEACQGLFKMSASYSDGRNPDDFAMRRAARRSAVEASGLRVKASVGEFWQMAELLRVSETVGFVVDTVAGKKPDSTKAAAAVMQPPAFPKLAMHMFHLSENLLHHDELAYQAAKARRTRELRLRGVFALVGVLLGILGAYWVFGMPAAAAAPRKVLPALPTPKPPARLE
ncbi:MAG: hypothetical protein HY928_14600 [Elusimicrobia bacterium]|nr:hypothetical protein [Elusimicrobiota bacterium]